jgi:transposase
LELDGNGRFSMANGTRVVTSGAAVAGVVGGVDTHGSVHVAAALDQVGRLLGTESFAVTPAGYAALAGWLGGFGSVSAVGVEGTGSYGAGLAGHLIGAGIAVLEVHRPDRAARRQRGKADDLDAISAARAVLAGTVTAQPKGGGGPVAAIRALRVARAGAIKARTAAFNQLKDLRINAPAGLRAGLDGLSLRRLATRAAASRPGGRDRDGQPDVATLADPATATRLAMRSVSRRITDLDTEITTLDTQLAALVAAAAPQTLSLHGAGPDTVGALLSALGDNPHRVRSEAALARLLGIAPIPASSGTTTAHRLHRGGDRAGNAAVYRMVIVRLRHHAPTRAYRDRRTRDGLPPRKIIRCLKRYLVREIYQALTADLNKINPQPAPA